MRHPDLPDRVQVLEDEVHGLESMIDKRTRTLWAEIKKLQAELVEVRQGQKPKE